MKVPPAKEGIRAIVVLERKGYRETLSGIAALRLLNVSMVGPYLPLGTRQEASLILRVSLVHERRKVHDIFLCPGFKSGTKGCNSMWHCNAALEDSYLDAFTKRMKLFYFPFRIGLPSPPICIICGHTLHNQTIEGYIKRLKLPWSTGIFGGDWDCTKKYDWNMQLRINGHKRGLLEQDSWKILEDLYHTELKLITLNFKDNMAKDSNAFLTLPNAAPSLLIQTYYYWNIWY